MAAVQQARQRRDALRDLDIIVNVSIRRKDARSYVDYRLKIISRRQGDGVHTYFCEGRGRLNQPMNFSFGPRRDGRRKHLVIRPKRESEDDSYTIARLSAHKPE